MMEDGSDHTDRTDCTDRIAVPVHLVLLLHQSPEVSKFFSFWYTIVKN